MSSGGVMLSGWLRKSPPERKLHRSAWKKRWFVLRSGRLSGDPNVLEYFRHQGSRRPIKVISLDQCSQIDANVPVKYDRKDPSHQFVFDIVTKQRTYFLIAESVLEMSSWVRYLCDLCGFIHDAPENQDLGSRQQTFKAVQLIEKQNGSTSLVKEEERLNGLVSPTSHSSLDRKKNVDSNGKNAGNKINFTTPSRVPSAGFHLTPHVVVDEADRYCYERNGDGMHSANGSDYLLLTDCKTAEVADDLMEDPNFLTAAKLGERRTSTDSVFTHEAACNDACNDSIADQPVKTPHMRFLTNIQFQRLSSMPDCPPPLPPTKEVDGSGWTIMSDQRDGACISEGTIDEGLMAEIRRKSYRTTGTKQRCPRQTFYTSMLISSYLSSTNGLSSIEDSDLNRVSLNQQREFRLMERGNPVGSHVSSSSSSNASSRILSSNRHPSSSNTSATEYINTTDASAEAGFGALPNHVRYDTTSQRYEQQFAAPGRSCLSPVEKSAFQYTNSPFYSSPTPHEGLYDTPRKQIYDVPSPMIPFYATPRYANPSISRFSNGSIYSSANVFSPASTKDSLTNQTSQIIPDMAKLRKSSSVGQLDNVTCELATDDSSQKTIIQQRRGSIDHRPGQKVYTSPTLQYYNNNTGFYASPAPLTKPQKAGLPPRRPPKSEKTVKKCLSQQPGCSPVPDHQEEEEDQHESLLEDSTNPVATDPVSPPHATIVNTEIFSFTNPGEQDESFDNKQEILTAPLSPAHSKVVQVIAICSSDAPISQADKLAKNTGAEESLHSDADRNRSESGNTSDSSQSDLSGTVNDISTTFETLTDTENKTVESNLYDIPRPSSINQCSNQPLYDTPRSKLVIEPPKVNGSDLYDVPAKLSDIARTFNGVDDFHSNHEKLLEHSTVVANEGTNASSHTSTNCSNHITSNPAFMANKSFCPIGRLPVVAEPPPVKRDLKPGRKSLGSDSGISDISTKPYHSRSSFEDSVSVHSDSPTLSYHTTDRPLSPPHSTIAHTIPAHLVMRTNDLADTAPSVRANCRLIPPARPPKLPSQTSFSPRSPPSANNFLPGRPLATKNTFDRPHKSCLENQVARSPSLIHSTSRQRVASNPPVPERPPKPRGMTPNTFLWDDVSYSSRGTRELKSPTRPMKSNTVFAPNHGAGNLFFPNKFPMVTPLSMQHSEREINYAKLEEFPSASPDTTLSSNLDASIAFNERLTADEGVQYIVLDHEKTEALERMKKDREQEKSLQKRGSIDSKIGKGGK